MLVTMTLARPGPATPATDLGYLLHKHPDRAQAFEVFGGTAHVFYPEADEERCTVALLLEVDPIALVRGRSGGRSRGRGPGSEGFVLGQYVNDRPYAASSLLAVALGKVFRTALAGRCDARPDLAAGPLPLTIRVPALPTGGDATLPTRLFGPLGWRVSTQVAPLDPAIPDWGDAPYADLRLDGVQRLADALNHLYVLLPVLDDAKHYWVGPDEVDKLVRAGGGWLADHPERELITHRYLAHQRSYVHTAVARLAESDDATPEVFEGCGDAEPRDPSAAEVRQSTVVAVVRALGAERVLDLGCGEGRLLQVLLAEPAVTEVAGTDVAPRALDRAERRLGLDRLPEARRARIRLFQSSLVYRDTRLRGYDAAVLMEVIEHLDPNRLAAVERTVFADARPGAVVVTTPNVEHNVRFDGLAAGSMRHRDHGSSGPVRSSVPGRAGSASGTDTTSNSGRSAPTTPRSAPRRSWHSSGVPAVLRTDRGGAHDGAGDPRARPRRPGRRLGLGQVDLRPAALRRDRGAVVGSLPGRGQRRPE